MMHRSFARSIIVSLLLVALSSCGSNEVRDGAPGGDSVAIPDLPGDAVPKPEPRSRYGNGPIYEVFGETYSVMNSDAG